MLELTGHKRNPAFIVGTKYFLLSVKNVELPSVSFKANYVLRKNDDGTFAFIAETGLTTDEIIGKHANSVLFNPIGSGKIEFFVHEKEFKVTGEYVKEVVDILRSAYPSCLVNGAGINDSIFKLFAAFQ